MANQCIEKLIRLYEEKDTCLSAGNKERYALLEQIENQLLEIVDRKILQEKMQDFRERQVSCELNEERYWLETPCNNYVYYNGVEHKGYLECIDKIPNNSEDICISVIPCGQEIRLYYRRGLFIRARLGTFITKGLDITVEVTKILEEQQLLELPELETYDLIEIRGYLLQKDKEFCMKEYKVGDKLDFIACKLFMDNFEFSRDAELSYLEQLGFFVVPNWNIECVTKETIYEELTEILEDCRSSLQGYEYGVHGFLLGIYDKTYFHAVELRERVIDFKKYKGYIQTVLWVQQGEYIKPSVLISKDNSIEIEFEDLGDYDFIFDIDEISNYEELGVIVNGVKIVKIPLNEPNMLILLDAYKGNNIEFVVTESLGVLPLLDGKPIIME